MTEHKTSFFRVFSLVLILFLAVGASAMAQYITGPANVEENSTAIYTYNDGLLYTFPNWVINGGTQISSSSSGSAYTVTVQWGSFGSGSVAFRDRTQVKGEHFIIITETQQGGGNSPNQNYIHTITPRVASTDISLLSDTEKVESIMYYDGLGRPLQQVGIRSGGDMEDIITHIEYDIYGRQVKEYLPYADTGNGGYRTAAASSVLSYYDTANYEEDFPGMNTTTINPYSEKAFDSSPLNRALKQAAPGKDWKMGNGHEIEMDYQSNTATEVRRYEVSLSFANNTYTPTLVLNTAAGNNNGYYMANELYKTVVRDENHDGSSTKNHTTEEFKDKQGHVILKRTYNNAQPHDTYYVYDVYGNLTYVLPPKAEPHTALPNANKMGELCYQYKYDHLNRLVEKKIPGKGWEYIVYNKLDQPILTQDAVQRTLNKWLFTKYDAFGRVAYTGEMTRNVSRTLLQGEVTGTSSQYVTKSGTSTTIDGTIIYYNNGAYPTSYITDILTINYYDSYTFDKVAGNSEAAYGITPITNVKGLAAGSKVRVLGTDHWITSVTYYDVKSRPIFVYSHNAYLNTTDKIKSQLDFGGNVTETTATHSRKGYNGITTVGAYTYDHVNRLLTHKQRINGAAIEEVITDNGYDDLGQLISKGVGGKTTQARLQTVDYAYNVRGWLKKINDPSALGNDLFSFKINYNTIAHSGTKLYNGNIAETEWRTANTDNSLKWYRYGYDALNRITSATDNINRYTLSGVQYDKNGNITNLIRGGHIVASPVSGNSAHFGTMDNLAW